MEMSASDDAQAIVDQLDALHTSLLQAWNTASNAGDFATARSLKPLSDHVGDQLIAARQHLLAAIDSGADVTNLLAAMDGLSARIKAEQQRVANGTQDLGELGGVLDAVDQVVGLAEQAGGGRGA
jgi:hypothetical protein